MQRQREQGLQAQGALGVEAEDMIPMKVSMGAYCLLRMYWARFCAQSLTRDDL